MQAIVQTQYGDPSVLQLREVDDPTPEGDQILVRVRATAVTSADCAFRSGQPWAARFVSGLFRPKHEIPGMCMAGDVVAVGPQVARFEVGDRVFGTTMQAGTHAQKVCIPQGEMMSILPHDLSYEQGIGALAGQTSLWFLQHVARVQPGQTVLINGASSEVGSTGVQIAKHLGARVVGVCSTRNLDLVRSMGADSVIDYTTTDFTGLTDRFDVVFDAVGKSTFTACKPLLNQGGIYLTTVPSLAIWWHQFWTSVRGDKRALFPMAGLNQSLEQQAELVRLVRSGALQPHVDRRYALADLADAHSYVQTGRKRGSVLITPALVG